MGCGKCDPQLIKQIAQLTQERDMYRREVERLEAWLWWLGPGSSKKAQEGHQVPFRTFALDALTGVEPSENHWKGYREWAPKGPYIAG